MTKEFMREIYRRFNELQKIAVGIVIDDAHVDVAMLASNEVKKLTFSQIINRKILVINIRSPDEKTLVRHNIPTVSLYVVCEICYGGPLHYWEYDKMFWSMSRFWYKSIEQSILSELIVKIIVRRLTHNLRGFKDYLSMEGCQLQFLIELELVPVLHSMYLDKTFPVDVGGIVKEISLMQKEKQEAEKMLIALRENCMCGDGDENTTLEVKRLSQRIKKLEKILSQFPVAKFQNPGGITCTVNTIGTETFRMSTSNINLYGLPKRFRKYLLPRKGEILMTLDIHASQIIILSWLSGEEKLISWYETDNDIYLHMASHFFNKEANDITGDERSAMKRVILLLVNGGGIEAMREALEEFGIHKCHSDVVDMRLSLFEYLPKILQYIREIESRDYLMLPSGRVWAEEFTPPPYKRLSRILQGIESEILKQSLTKAYQRLQGYPNTAIYMSLHDSITVETMLTEKEAVNRVICESVNEVFRLYFPNSKKIIIKEE